MRNCALCGNIVNRGKGFFLYCSHLCSREAKLARYRRYHEQNKDRCCAKSRDWQRRNLKRAINRVNEWRKNNPEKYAKQPARLEARLEAKRKRLRRADIKEMARQMERLRWHIYGDGLIEQMPIEQKPVCVRLTQEEGHGGQRSV